MEAPVRTDGWPSLRVDDWTPTRDTLHMWTQIVGKVRLAHMPLINHWWQVTLYVSPRGLTTGAIPYGTAVFDMEFDFVANVLAIRLSDGSERSVPLASRPVAEFYGETLSALDSLGIASQIVAHPNEVDPAIPFAEDFEHAEFDADAAHMFWQQLVQAHRVILDFRASFTGKVSPVHFFWGALDLACTRFSGRAAPTARRRSTKLPRLGDGRGLFARVEQLRLLARRRRRGRVLFVRVSRTARLRGIPR